MVDKEKIKQMYEAGHTTTAIAEELGLRSASSINRYLVKMGVPRRPVGKAAADRTGLKTQLESMLAEGLTDIEIGEKLVLKPDSVRKYRNRAGLLRKRTGGTPIKAEGRTAEIVLLRREGLSLNAIAARFKISRAAVQGALDRAEASKVPRNLNHEEWIAAYQEGHSLRKIALRFGVTAPTVLFTLRRAGIDTSVRGTPKYEPRCNHKVPALKNRIQGWCPSCYYKNNPDAVQRGNQNRIRRLAAAPGAHTPAEWKAKKAEYDNRCAYCGEQNERIGKDHVVPLTKDGTNSIDNLVPACRSCNSRKHRSLAWVPLTATEVKKRFGSK